MNRTRIDLIYNPFTQAARLECDGKDICRPGSRLQICVAGKPMQKWLHPVTQSYHQWNGILPELAVELNEDSFTLAFSGTQEDYQAFAGAVREQDADLSDYGFAPGRIELAHIPRYTAGQILREMRELRQNWGVAIPSQKLLLQRDALDARLQECAGAEETRELAEGYAEIISRMIREISDPRDKSTLLEMRAAWEALLQ